MAAKTVFCPIFGSTGKKWFSFKVCLFVFNFFVHGYVVQLWILIKPDSEVKGLKCVCRGAEEPLHRTKKPCACFIHSNVQPLTPFVFSLCSSSVNSTVFLSGVFGGQTRGCGTFCLAAVSYPCKCFTVCCVFQPVRGNNRLQGTRSFRWVDLWVYPQFGELEMLGDTAVCRW